ncbi:MAG: hypothetical protein IKM04_08080 [Clostridia bacterium]|nr:hypothetical protein [Clostridia bacterium]
MSIAEIKDHNGSPAITVDGRPYPPMAFTVNGPLNDPEYIRELGKAGFKLFFIETNTDWFQPGDPTLPETAAAHVRLSGSELFEQSARTLLKYIPDAYIIVRIALHPPTQWLKDHPEELMRYNDGGNLPVDFPAELSNYFETLPGMYSLCSKRWREDGGRALAEFCDKAEALPFADRIIGYFLCAGGTSEWYPVNHLEKWAAERYGDFSQGFLEHYSSYLKEKYGDEETLKRVWRRDDVSFYPPHIPPLNEREHLRAHSRISNRMKDCYYDSTPVENTLGVFLDVDKCMATLDFYRAWHDATADSVIHFARLLKKRSPNLLVGAFFGAMGCTEYYNASTCGGILKVLDSGYFDFLSAPGVYTNRWPGGYVAQREVLDAFRLRNMVFISEEDSRTHLQGEGDIFRDSMMLYGVEDSVNTLKRDFARNLCQDSYGWWYDQFYGGGRYDCPEILELFKRQNEISELAFSLDRKKKNEVAVIYDLESIHSASIGSDDLLVDFYRSTDLSRIGVPVDFHFHNDLLNPQMPDYKLYVMLNVFYLTEQEREAIHTKAARNGATVLWLYASGFIDPNAEKRMENAHIERLTGFKVGRDDRTTSPRFRICSDHPAVKYHDPDRVYGWLDRELRSNIWVGTPNVSPFVNPRFYIEESPDSEVLGRYCLDGRVAYALKCYKGFTSAYCASQIPRAELVASLAEYAGCHLYTKSDDCLYANESFVSIHAAYTGSRTVYFKRPCDPYEVYQKKYYGHSLTELTVTMKKGETLTFCVAPNKYKE